MTKKMTQFEELLYENNNLESKIIDLQAENATLKADIEQLQSHNEKLEEELGKALQAE